MSRRVLLVVGVALAFVAAASSFPPDVYPLGFKIPTPAFFFHSVLTTWRVYSRFELVAAIGLITLAAVGLTWLAGSGKRRVVVLVLATVIIPLDLGIKRTPPVPTDAPQIAAAIHALPPGTLAAYPLERGEGDGFGAIYHQASYGRPVLNGFDDQATESRAAAINDLSKPSTIASLGALGVRYVLVVNRLPGMPGTPPIPAQLAPGLTPVAHGMYGTWPATVYEVHAKPNQVLVSPGRSYLGYPGTTTGPTWATSTQSSLLLDGNCAPSCQGTVGVRLTAFSGAQHISIKSNGRVLPVEINGKMTSKPFLIQPGVQTTIAVPITFRKTAALTITTDGKPTLVGKVVIGSADPRELSVGLTAFAWQSKTSTDVAPVPLS